MVSHQIGAYPGVGSMNKGLEVLLFLPGRDASPLQGYPQHFVSWYPFLNLGGKRSLRATCFAQDHISMSQAIRAEPEHSYRYFMYISLYLTTLFSIAGLFPHFRPCNTIKNAMNE